MNIKPSFEKTASMIRFEKQTQALLSAIDTLNEGEKVFRKSLKNLAEQAIAVNHLSPMSAAH